MKIILDENLPRKLKSDFGPGFEIKTVRDMGWLGKKNGELLNLIAINRFDIFVTIDKNLPRQQNLNKFNFSIFILSAKNNRRETLQKLIEKIKSIILKGNFKRLKEIS